MDYMHRYISPIGSKSGFNSLYNLIETRTPAAFRLALFIYVLIYRVLTPPAVLFQTGEIGSYFLLRVASNATAELVAILPLLLFKRVGFFHPLAFVPIYNIAFDVAFQPAHLFFPFVLSAKPWFIFSPSWASSLQSINQIQYEEYNILYNIATTIFLLSVYAGFQFTRHKRKQIPPVANKASSTVLSSAIYLVGAIAFGWLFIMSRGGIEAQLLSFYQGRFESLAGSGVFTVATKVASVAVLLWLAYDTNAERSIVFWIFVVSLIPIYWLVDGSRSSVMLLLMTILIVISFKFGRIPVKAGILAGIAAFTMFGALGILRQDYSATSVDYSVLDISRIGDWVAASQQETNKRAAEEGDLAAFVAANESGLLWGKSYLSVLAYPIPRALWADKPKNIFSYNTWIAFLGNSDDDSAPEIWGIPVNATSEAFWNFGWVGLLAVGYFVGSGLKWAMTLFRSRDNHPWAAVMYVEFLLYFTGGSRWALYLIQNLVGLYLILFAAKLIRGTVPHSRKDSADASRRHKGQAQSPSALSQT